MEWVPVNSRMLSAVAYNSDWKQLYLEFRSGEIYCYGGVPAERHQELLAADSKGKYVRRHILNRYPHQRIPAALRTAS
jgi:hypothetical protein